MSYEYRLYEALNKLEDIERALNESSIVAITDQRGVIQFANNQFCKISQYSREELIGSKQSIVNSGYHSKEFMKDLWRTIGKGNVWKGEIKNMTKNGSYYWVDTTIVPFLDERGKPYQYISIRHDITVRKRYEEMMEHMAYHDPLTSLPNRNYVKKQLNDKSFSTNTHLAILYLDLDQFKYINDTFGHHIGDAVLVEVSDRLRNIAKLKNIKHFITRYGGDTFVILLDDIQCKEVIVSIAEQIQDHLSKPLHLESNTIEITASIGIIHTELPPNERLNNYMFDQLIEKASIALYYAKSNGGNTYSFNTDEQNYEIEKLYKIELDISVALEKEQFYLVYQPLVQLNDRKIQGVEALLRWQHPELGLIRPNEFIPILEKREYIIPVGEWILRTVCKQMKDWLNQGTPLKMISVNVSPIQLSFKDFVPRLKEILEQTGLDGKHLELEITESTILNIQEPKKTFEQLEELDVRVSIDDFGMGYSSLSRLKELPIDTLKIDKSFIDHLDDNGEIIVDTIINMGKNLKYTVVAEGIETSKQLDYLKQQKCHLGQGFYFNKPMIAAKIPKLVTT